MHYLVARNGQTYGPYTLEDLQRYVASGHVLLTDSARSADSSGQASTWTPVSQILSTVAGTAAGPATAGPYSDAAGVPPGTGANPPGAYPPAGYPAAAGGYPGMTYDSPPNLNWGLVLLFDVLTCSLFQAIWNLVISAWLKRAMPTSRALWLYIASAILLFGQGIFGQTLGLMAGRHGHGLYTAGYVYHGGYAAYGLLALTTWVVRLIARFTMSTELEHHFNTVDPVGLRLNPVLTFFFGGLYFQSQINRINEIKRAVRFGGFVPR